MLLRRAAALWLLGRLMIVAFLALAQGAYQGAGALVPDAVRLGLVASLELSAIVAGLTLLDVFRRHEVILLANLGTGRAGVFGLALMPPLLLEALTWLIPV